MLLGHSGCGKGTQAALLQRRYGLKKLSLGDHIRHCLVRDKAGLRSRLPVVANNLWVPLPDEIACDLVAQLIEPHREFVLDGFPRSVGQARVVRELIRPDRIVVLGCSDHARQSRIAFRDRKSDTPQRLAARYAVEIPTLPLIVAELERCGCQIVTVDSEDSIEAVHHALVGELHLNSRNPLASLTAAAPVIDL